MGGKGAIFRRFLVLPCFDASLQLIVPRVCLEAITTLADGFVIISDVGKALAGPKISRHRHGRGDSGR